MTLTDSRRLIGLTAATHTPFHDDGSLHLAPIETQAAHLSAAGVATVFIGGTTGESASLTVTERLSLTERWLAVVRGSALRVVVHVGANCLADAAALAAHAEKSGATAISALAPSYFKPRSIDTLVDCCAHIAIAAPNTPFYYYDIPSLTGVSFPMADFLESATARIPTLAGLKFTNPDLMAYQFALRAAGGAFDLPWGVDEHFLGALAIGARGAVGSGFNFAAPVYRRLIAAWERGDLEAARCEQFRGTQLIQLLARYGYMAAAKSVMSMLGIPVGPPRLPHQPLTADQIATLRRDLESLGFFEWIR